jgi:hypothetical protein
MALALSGGLTFVATARSGPDAEVLLPDLRSVVPPGELRLEYGFAGQLFLRFEHVIYNAGLGRLEARPDYDARTGTAANIQRLWGVDAAGAWHLVREQPTEGAYAFDPPHEHYHFPVIVHALHEVAPDGGVGRSVAPSHKVGYCLGDTYIVERNRYTPEPDSDLLYPRETCRDPRAMRGISPGWGDQYEADLEGQSINVNHLEEGDYWFVSTADPDDVFLESDETNNTTLVKIHLSRTGVTVLEPAP